MEDDWEALAEQEVVPIPTKPKVNINKWDGEDEDDVKDSWEDEEDEKKDEEKNQAEPPQPAKVKPNKKLQAKLDEKERKRQEEEDRLEEERIANMTPEERLAEKLRLQQIEKENDLKMALATFGVSEVPGGLDSFTPTNKAEFEEFAQAISNKVSVHKTAPEFPGFVEELVRSICANLCAADLRKIKLVIDSLHAEQQKIEKEKAKKPAAKGKSKIKLRIEQENVKSNKMEDYGEGYNDYDDFM